MHNIMLSNSWHIHTGSCHSVNHPSLLYQISKKFTNLQNVLLIYKHIANLLEESICAKKRGCVCKIQGSCMLSYHIPYYELRQKLNKNRVNFQIFGCCEFAIHQVCRRITEQNKRLNRSTRRKMQPFSLSPERTANSHSY